ncbi:MAG: hypothetical protein WC102_08630, partial [Saccharofermentanales bacterium]
GKWSGAVADYASLPEGQNDGEARITLDDSKIYVWSAAEESWKLAGAGGGAGTVYVTNKLGTEAEGGDNKTFTMNSGSFPNDNFLMVYLNGVLQENGSGKDYTTDNGNTVIFENEVEATDKITMLVVSVSLVALGGVLTQDVIPDADETYNIGSEDFKINEIHAKKIQINEIHAKELNATNIIDPDNPVAQSAGSLIGGVGQRMYENLYDDGVETTAWEVGYLNADGTATKQSSYLQLNVSQNTSGSEATFVTTNKIDLTGINKVVVDWDVLAGQNLNNDFYIVVSSIKDNNKETYDLRVKVDVNVTPGRRKTTLDVSSLSGSYYIRVHNYCGYSISIAYANIAVYDISLFKTPADAGFSVNIDGVDYNNVSVNLSSVDKLSDIASLIQSAIRTATSKTETVTYDTDHFVITSSLVGRFDNTGSQVLKLTAPTTGTDISGAGYLDLGANATETPGAGDDYKIVRLDEDGQVPLSKLTKLSNQIGGNQVITGRALNTVYQNTSSKTKIVLVSTLNSGYNSTSTSDSIAYIGATSTPNILVGYYSTTAGGNNRGQLCMLVPPGYYYTITATKGSSATLPSLVSWFECDLI